MIRLVLNTMMTGRRGVDIEEVDGFIHSLKTLESAVQQPLKETCCSSMPLESLSNPQFAQSRFRSSRAKQSESWSLPHVSPFSAPDARDRFSGLESGILASEFCPPLSVGALRLLGTGLLIACRRLCSIKSLLMGIACKLAAQAAARPPPAAIFSYKTCVVPKIRRWPELVLLSLHFKVVSPSTIGAVYNSMFNHGSQRL